MTRARTHMAFLVPATHRGRVLSLEWRRSILR